MIERRLTPDVHVTTNGTLWNDRIEHYLHRLRMNVAVSIDGASRTTFEDIRSGASFTRVCAIRDKFISATRSYGASFIINHCLLACNAVELPAFLRHADELDVNVHVIPVTYPFELSLYSLSVTEFSDIVLRLDRDDARLRTELQRNLHVWDSVLDMLHEHLRRIQSPTPDEVLVRITARRARLSGPTVRDPVALAAQERDLRSWTGLGLIELTTIDGILTSVITPPWGRALALDQWIGRPSQDMEGVLPSFLGDMVQSHTATANGLVEVQMDFNLPDGLARVRTIVVPVQDEGAERQRILVGVEPRIASLLATGVRPEGGQHGVPLSPGAT